MKNKIFKYDFLIIGSGLIGAITAYALCKKNFNVLIIDKNDNNFKDNRTLAVNANSKELLEQLGIWNELKFKPQPINKIVIKDYINSSPLLFINKDSPMGSVIFNKELHKILIKKLKTLKALKTNTNLDLRNITPNKLIKIRNRNYKFKKIIVSIGKSINMSSGQKSIIFNKNHHSYVGFFNHENDHKNIAYEIFKKEGPLAVLPSPSKDRRKSTFIFSTNKDISYLDLKLLIKKNFNISHGKLKFDKLINKFPITPHLKKYDKNYIYIGDTLRSIHPVAGQGWNLGVKDIQTLCKLIEQYPLESKIFNSIYYSRRAVESVLYLGFTSLVNYLYENQNTVNKNVLNIGFRTFRNFRLLRDLFIKQAMGKINLID